MDVAMRDAVAKRIEALKLLEVDALKALPVHKIEPLPAMVSALLLNGSGT
jgi:hypothetical protein